MKIAVVNDIHSGPVLTYNGVTRASSHLIDKKLVQVLQNIIEQHSPDILIQLGDLIRSEKREVDFFRYQRLINSFQSLNHPVIHVLGNHELKKMSLGDIETIWNQAGIEQASFGIKQLSNLNLVWIGLEPDPTNYAIRSLPKAQLNWLENTLNKTSLPTLLFTHCAIDDHDVNGNYFYEAHDARQKSALFLENQADIRAVISKSNCVIGVIQAHLHYFHAKTIDGIPYITCPAMGDNICGPFIEDNIPEIYTILNFNRNGLVVKAFSREYCFAGYEYTIESISVKS